MFGPAFNQLALSLFFYIIVPSIIIGLFIILGPRLIRKFFIFLFSLLKFLFRLLSKKTLSEPPKFYAPARPTPSPKTETSPMVYVNLKETTKPISSPKTEISPIIHETLKRTPESLNANHIHDLSPKNFEFFIGIILGKMGFYGIKVTGRPHDEGVDLEAYKVNKLYVIQCKRYKKTVGRSDIQKLFGVMTDKKADGYFFTSGKFSKGAKEFSDGKPIELIDGEQLIETCNQNGIKTDKQLSEEITKTFS